MERTAEAWIERLGLEPHPEGGFYRETYRAAARAGTPGGERSCSTAIYYLLRSGEVSRLHRLPHDELFHFYDGSELSVHVLDRRQGYRRVPLGRDPARGCLPQAVVPAGSWFGATVEAPGSFALVGCTVAPGFEFDDLEIGSRERLRQQWPDRAELIRRLTPA